MDNAPRQPEAGGVVDVAPETLAGWVRQGGTIIVDVREDFEYAEEHIEGAVLVPLSRFDAEGVRDAHGESRVVFQCRSGKRSLTAAAAYLRTGDADETLFHLAGGIEAWKQAGLPVNGPGSSGKPASP
jgi:rhodanese-related sulfurtransferase